MSYTKGPWTTGAVYKQKVFAADGQMTVCDIRGWGYLTGVGGLKLSEEDAIAIQDANARLITAAPDLLEACKLTVERGHRASDMCSAYPDAPCTCGYAAAKAAVDKAKAKS